MAGFFDDALDRGEIRGTPTTIGQSRGPSILGEVHDELVRAQRHGEFHSAHEGYAVLLEEVDELKAHVWMRPSLRDVDAMRKEAIQVAAMAIRFIQMLDGGNRR